MSGVTVIKLNEFQKETWRYQGEVLIKTPGAVVLEAFFNRDYVDTQGLVMRRGDRFVEAYFSGRWFNIFEIHERESDALKGFYCNITYPARIAEEEISYIDLALDLLVFTDGRQIVLDKDEFAELKIAPEDKAGAEQALAGLQSLFRLYGNGIISALVNSQ